MQIIVIGLFMGVAFAAPPGAVTAETIRQGVRGGFGRAFGVQLGSLVGDATYALLALAGLAALAQIPALQFALGAFGGLFLLYLAWNTLASAGAEAKAAKEPQIDRPLPAAGREDVRAGWDSPGTARTAALHAFLSGMAISLTNPWAIAFWLALGGALTAYGLANAGAQRALFFASFMAGSALWACALSFGIGRLELEFGRRPMLHRAVTSACAIALAAFGVAAAGRAISLIFAS